MWQLALIKGYNSWLNLFLSTKCGTGIAVDVLKLVFFILWENINFRQSYAPLTDTSSQEMW